MCLTQPGTVLARFGREVLVDVDGRNRLVSNLVVPDVHVGDAVLVGLGTVLGRVSAAEATELRELRSDALDGPGDAHDARPMRRQRGTHRSAITVSTAKG